MTNTRRHNFGWTVALALLTVATSAQTNEPGLIYGKDFAFNLLAPNGWLLDDAAKQKIGAAAVFLPEGSVWATAPAVIYVTTVPKRTDASFTDLIASDIERHQTASSGLKVAAEAPLPAADGTLIQINKFSGDKWGNVESVGYIEAPTVLILIVFSAKGEEAHAAHHAAFADILKSYRFLTSKIQIEGASQHGP